MILSRTKLRLLKQQCLQKAVNFLLLCLIVKLSEGNGYACESVGAFIRYAFDKIGARRIMAEIDVRNERSFKLCERLGMRREAEFKQVYPSKEGGYNDFYIYAILKEEYSK